MDVLCGVSGNSKVKKRARSLIAPDPIEGMADSVGPEKKSKGSDGDTLSLATIKPFSSGTAVDAGSHHCQSE